VVRRRPPNLAILSGAIRPETCRAALLCGGEILDQRVTRCRCETPLGGHTVRGVTRAPAQARGAPLARVTINVAQLLRWCAANGTVLPAPPSWRLLFGPFALNGLNGPE
jgi:hypothetical protein